MASGLGCGGRSVSNLLLDEYPLLVLPGLAVRIGLNEALFCQQLHFWITKSGQQREGNIWVHKTYDEWRLEDFPFWSVETVKRVILGLEEKGYVISQTFNRMKIDRTKWYRLEYAKFSRQVESPDHQVKMTRPSGQNDPLSLGQIDPSNNQRQDHQEETNITIGGNYTFEEFKHDFPRWRNGSEAKHAWDELNPDDKLQADIRDGLKRAKNSTDWEAKRFIPKPSTWLNDRGWEDEYIARNTNAVLKAKPEAATAPAEPATPRREMSDAEKSQNSRKLREALHGKLKTVEPA
jgi:hypothetical protein